MFRKYLTIAVSAISFLHARVLPILKMIRPGAPKVLIVSFADIGGHASLTNALTSCLKNTCEVHVLKAENFNRYINADYYGGMKLSFVFTVVQQSLHHIIHNFMSKMPNPVMNLFYKINRFNELLDENDYALVIFTSPVHLNEINRICKKRRIPSMTIAADFGEPDNVHEFWIRTECDIHIVPANGYFTNQKKYGSKQDVLHTSSGIPIRREFANIRRTSKRRAKREIGVDPNQPCVLIMMGAAGANDIREIAEYVKHDTEKTYVFICGKNDEAYAKLKLLDVKNFIVLKYVSKPMMYMRAADVFISKPGATSITESIQCETPCVFKSDSVFGFLPSEVPTARYIVENGMGCVIHDYADLLKTINRMLKTKYYFPYNNALEQSVHMIRRLISPKNG